MRCVRLCVSDSAMAWGLTGWAPPNKQRRFLEGGTTKKQTTHGVERRPDPETKGASINVLMLPPVTYCPSASLA